MRKPVALVGLAIGVGAILLQAAISIPAGVQAGRTILGALIWFFSYFTILTNIGVVLVYLAELTDGAGWLRPFQRPRLRAGVAVAITVVLLVYATVLARIWQPRGLFYICDIALHYVTPLVYLGWWIVYGAEGSTRWRDMAAWLIYPLLYLGYVLVRAPIAGEVPYPFLDYWTRGAAAVAASALAIFILFVVLGVLAVLLDRLLGRIRQIGRRRQSGMERIGE